MRGRTGASKPSAQASRERSGETKHAGRSR
jgi:hypothetical protein